MDEENALDEGDRMVQKSKRNEPPTPSKSTKESRNAKNFKQFHIEQMDADVFAPEPSTETDANQAEIALLKEQIRELKAQVEKMTEAYQTVTRAYEALKRKDDDRAVGAAASIHNPENAHPVSLAAPVQARQPAPAVRTPARPPPSAAQGPAWTSRPPASVSAPAHRPTTRAPPTLKQKPQPQPPAITKPQIRSQWVLVSVGDEMISQTDRELQRAFQESKYGKIIGTIRCTKKNHYKVYAHRQVTSPTLLTDDRGWLSIISPAATIINASTWTEIFAHYVERDDTMCTEDFFNETRESIEDQNLVKLALAPRWLTPYAEGRKHGSLVLTLEDPQEAKYLIKSKVIVYNQCVRAAAVKRLPPKKTFREAENSSQHEVEMALGAEAPPRI